VRGGGDQLGTLHSFWLQDVRGDALMDSWVVGAEATLAYKGQY